MAKENNTALWVVGGAAAAYLLLNSSSKQTSPVTALTTAANNLINTATNSVVPSTTTYPYLMPGAPGIPSAYNQAYYATYIRPAMVAANPNVNNPGYTLSQTDATNYMANYTDVMQWANNTGKQGGARNQTPYQACVYHWKTYGIPDQRTFLPLPWNDPGAWVPPPANSGSSGGGILSDALSVATTVAAFMGEDEPLNDAEINLLVTSAAIIKKILPYYLQVAPELVNSISVKLDNLVSKYAN